MINVNQITSQLAKMPDQALQQYAMMHKNDPYTVSLALSESNRRKQMRDAAQGQQGMAPQPKVVDQGIAGMLPPAPQPQMPQEQAQPMPEDVGIGSLPAPNMQGMAGGGIVAFAGEDGSLVTDPQFGGVTSDMSGFFGATAKPPVARTGRTEAEVAAIVEAMRARGETVGLAQIIDIQNAVKKPAIAPPVVIPSVPPTAPSVKPAAAPAVKPPVDRGLASLGGAPRAPAVAEKDYLTQLTEMGKKAAPAVDPNKAAREDITAEDIKGRREGIASLKKDQAADLAAMFKGKEERIGKREAELGKSKDANTGMAFLEAGLAMMQSRGPGLAGIAQGAGVGLKQYQSGIKDIKAAQEKLDDARDRMEELRQNQESMNKREVRAEEKGIRDTVVAGKRDLLAGAEKATGVQQADFRAAVASNITVSEAAKTRATTLDAARIAAGPGMERNKMLAASQNDTAKARAEYGKLQAKVMGDLAKEPMYQLATPAEQATMQTTRLRNALMNNPFLSAYAAGIGFSSAPASGTVRTLDADE